MSATSAASQLPIWKRRPWLCIVTPIITLLTVVALFLVHTSGNNGNVVSSNPKAISPADGLNIGEGVTASSLKLPDGLRATLPEMAALAAGVYPEAFDTPEFFEPLTPLIDIGPSGSLETPLTINFTLSRAVTAEDTITVLTNSSHTPNGWQRSPHQLSADGMRLSIVVDRLSFFQVFNTFVKSVTGVLTNGIANTVGSGALAEAKPPNCPDENRAKTDGYDVTQRYEAANTVYYCFGYDDDTNDRVLRVVNNRRYPLEITTDKAAVIDSGPIGISMGEAYRLNHLVIMPRDEMVFQVNPLDAGGEATVETRLSNWSLGLGVLNTVYDILLTALTKSTNTKKLQQLVNAAMLVPACYNNFDTGDFSVTSVIANCFDDTALSQAFGPAGLLLAPAMITLTTLDTGRGLVNALSDRTKGRDKYRVIVSRVAQEVSPLAVFSGTWKNYYQTITINADGTGTQVSDFGNGPSGNKLIQEADLRLTFLSENRAAIDYSNVGWIVDEADIGEISAFEAGTSGVAYEGLSLIVDVDQYNRLDIFAEDEIDDGSQPSLHCSDQTPQAQRGPCEA